MDAASSLECSDVTEIVNNSTRVTLWCIEPAIAAATEPSVWRILFIVSIAATMILAFAFGCKELLVQIMDIARNEGASGGLTTGKWTQSTNGSQKSSLRLIVPPGAQVTRIATRGSSRTRCGLGPSGNEPADEDEEAESVVNLVQDTTMSTGRGPLHVASGPSDNFKLHTRIELDTVEAAGEDETLTRFREDRVGPATVQSRRRRTATSSNSLNNGEPFIVASTSRDAQSGASITNLSLKQAFQPRQISIEIERSIDSEQILVPPKCPKYLRKTDSNESIKTVDSVTQKKEQAKQ